MLRGGAARATPIAGEPEMGMIPAQTQLQTALAINMGADGKQVAGVLGLSKQWGSCRLEQTDRECSRLGQTNREGFRLGQTSIWGF